VQKYRDKAKKKKKAKNKDQKEKRKLAKLSKAGKETASNDKVDGEESPPASSSAGAQFGAN
jgi:hypothetical protein